METIEPVTIASLLAVFRRRRVWFWSAVGVVMLLAVLYACVATPRYRATAEIEVQKGDGGTFGLESSVNGGEASQGASDSLDYTMTLQTEANLLRSPALVVAAIRAAGLEGTHDYFPAKRDGHSLDWAKLLFWRKPVEPLQIPMEQAPNRRAVEEKTFLAHLTVKPVTGTRLMELSYADPDPERAARVVNTTVRVLEETEFQQRLRATIQGSSWLAGQLAQLKAQTESLQAKASVLQRGTGMFGSDASRNVVLERLDSLNQMLTSAEENRILKESIDRVAASGDPELISSLSGNSGSSAANSVDTSLTLIRTLRSQEAEMRAALAEDSERYGPKYPRIAEEQAQLAGVEGSIAKEVKRLGERAHSDFEVAQRAEAGARAMFDQQKNEASRMNDAVLAYQLAKQEADSSRDLYEGLLAKLKQASMLEGLRESNVVLVSAAEVPPTNRAGSPNLLLLFAAAMVAGVLLGAFVVLIVELSDDTLFGIADVERWLGASLLGVIPRISGATAGMRFAAPEGDGDNFSEAVRGLRTVLQLSRGEDAPRAILVTGCLPSDGKSTIAANLAAMYARDGAKVLLVDADLRRPSLYSYVERKDSGLATMLSGAGGTVVQRPMTALPGLHILCGEETPQFPAELLHSQRMRDALAGWRAEYDVVILDAPSVLPVVDAVLLSPLCDATLLVARYKRTTKQALRRAIGALQGAGSSGSIGVVLNDVDGDSREFASYFGYKRSVYAHSS